MKLVIAEKPSVALSIAKVLGAADRHNGYVQGSGYIVSWCVGHLMELAGIEAYGEQYVKWRYDTLPIVPPEWKYSVKKDTKQQLDVLCRLMKSKNVDSVVCATDAGREGELIFRLVYQYAKCKKPMERLWISSMEDQAIRDGFESLRPGKDYDLLYQAALCRSEADWLVGINATRLFSVLYHTKLNVGRVMSPTLALLVKREAEIQDFQSKAFYVPEITCGDFTASGERTEDKSTAEKIAAACSNQTATVVSVEKQNKTVQPPKLYDLTTLQRDCNRIFGFTAKQTLDYLQTLYEKKLATYPRTDSQFLTEDMRDTAAALIEYLRAYSDYGKVHGGNPDIARVTNNKKVTDHHAIIPTMELSKVIFSELPKGEQCVLSLIAERLLCATAQPHIFEATSAELSCSGYPFTVKGKTVVQNGWKEIESVFLSQIKQKVSDDTALSLPTLSEGQTLDNIAVNVREGKTSPPKRYTEDTLLSAMENAGADETPDDAERKGLGTPATRAAILEKLVSTGFVERNKKLLIPTQKGIKLITVLPDNIKSPLLTAEWESKLKQVERGEINAEHFMREIQTMCRELVQTHSEPEQRFLSLFPRNNSGEVVGTCPRCGSAVREGQKGFYCDNSDCKFALWKDNYFFRTKKKTVTKAIAAALLKEGRVYVHDLYSEKADKMYSAFIVLDDTGDKYVNYKLEFPQKKGKRK